MDQRLLHDFCGVFGEHHGCSGSLPPCALLRAFCCGMCQALGSRLRRRHCKCAVPLCLPSCRTAPSTKPLPPLSLLAALDLRFFFCALALGLASCPGPSIPKFFSIFLFQTEAIQCLKYAPAKYFRLRQELQKPQREFCLKGWLAFHIAEIMSCQTTMEHTPQNTRNFQLRRREPALERVALHVKLQNLHPKL